MEQPLFSLPEGSGGEKDKGPGVVVGRGSSLVPLPQTQDSMKEYICIRGTESGSKAQKYSEKHRLSAHTPKESTLKEPQEDTFKKKRKRVTRTGGKQ